MDNETRRKIEHKFYNYKNLSDENEQRQMDIILENIISDTEKAPPQSGKKGSPVESKALRLMESDLNKSWIQVVQNTYIHFKFVDFHFILMQELYINGLRRKDILAKYTWLSEWTYHYYKKQWLLLAERWAKEFGLLDKDSKDIKPQQQSAVFYEVENP